MCVRTGLSCSSGIRILPSTSGRYTVQQETAQVLYVYVRSCDVKLLNFKAVVREMCSCRALNLNIAQCAHVQRRELTKRAAIIMEQCLYVVCTALCVALRLYFNY